jgi:hypothetical protein
MIRPRWYKEKFQLDYNFLNKTIYELPLLGSVWHKVANIAIAPTFGQHLDNFVHMMPPDDKQISGLCERREFARSSSLLKKIHNVVSSLPVDDRGSRWAELQCLLQNFQNETENGAAHIGAIITNPTEYHGKGRPKQKRFKGSQEVKYSSTKCSKCGQIGHNKRTCTTY